MTDWLREQSPLTEEELQKLCINMDDFKVRACIFIILPLLAITLLAVIHFQSHCERERKMVNNTIEKAAPSVLLLQFAFVVAYPQCWLFRGLGWR